MKRPKKDAEIKIRIDESTKAAAAKLAFSQDLDLSDIVRRAVREFILRHQLS